jgi:Domain of unknown function (DUF1931)
MHVTGVARFERFFRVAAHLDVDKDDLRRCREFVNHKVSDLLVRAEALAKANERDIIQRIDLPITKGLQESILQFEKLDAEVELEPVLERITTWPQLDFGLSQETGDYLPLVAGGLLPRAGLHVPADRSARQEPPDRALGAGVPDLRPSPLNPDLRVAARRPFQNRHVMGGAIIGITELTQLLARATLRRGP